MKGELLRGALQKSDAAQIAPLLVEICTEELPPAQLWRLADAFPDSLLDALRKAGFAGKESRRAKNRIGGGDKLLATPRRLVALLQNIKGESAAKKIVRRGPQIAACKDSEGAPTKALIGFMHSVGVSCESDLREVEENGRRYIAWKGEESPRRLADDLAAIVERVLLNLPAPRLMRWGDNDFKFVRPVRGVLMIHGNKIIKGEVFGVRAGETTKGHPVLCAEAIAPKTADEYESVMRKKGKVIADMNERLEKIRRVMVKADLGVDEAHAMDEPEVVRNNTGVVVDERNRVHCEGPLLREAAAMCENENPNENPIVHRRQIGAEFMSLPQPCIVECMKTHLRFFPFADERGNLLPDYFLVADNAPKDSCAMLRGYDAVLRARLNDVRYYYETDKAIPLPDYVEKLKTIVFHKKLGSQHDRIARVCRIAAALSELREERYSAEEIEDAARKFLAPLSTLMVGEYPNLQEYMGRQYFGESRAFYFVCLCYDLEKLAGMFGAGETPTGSRDPHGLRRNALKVAHSFRQWRDIKAAIAAAAESFDGKIADVREELYEFILERIRFIFSDHSPYLITFPVPSTGAVEAVLSLKPSDWRRLDDVIDAVHDFAKKKESAPFAAANKRINNIFRKSGVDADALPAADKSLFTEDAERALHSAARALRAETDSQIAGGDYAAALRALAGVAAPADAFFDSVLVNAEDAKIRANRFALLRELRALLNRVADISMLA